MGSLNAIHIPYDGSTCTLIEGLSNDQHVLYRAMFPAAEAVEILGGRDIHSGEVESVRIRGHEQSPWLYLLVDGDGIARGHSFNRTASGFLYPGEIFGDCLLVRGSYEREYSSALPEDLTWVEKIRTGG